MSASFSAALRSWSVVALLATLLLACDDAASSVTGSPIDPDTAPRVAIDRFSDQAGVLFRRTAMPTLPGANEPIDIDEEPFITRGLGPAGQQVRYYNFDVQPVDPAPIYVLYREGDAQPVPGQLNIVDVIPGSADYNDFWQLVRVTVPRSYVANTVTSLADIVAAGYAMEATNVIVNCPIVPAGSTGTEGGAATGLIRGWFRDQVVFYFTFGEAPLIATNAGDVPTAPIFVTFTINPDEPNGGPPSGFRTEPGTPQTHNVVSVLPGDEAYSPLWDVLPYDTDAFDAVHDLATAQGAENFGLAARVNCPVVFVAEGGE